MKFSKKAVYKTTLYTTAILLTACSSSQYAPDPADPLQGMNRATFSFNEKLDKYAIKPVAQGYTFITPQVVRNRVTNFFSNIGEVPTFANDTLQGNLKLSVVALGRFAINTTVGLLGLFDPASSMGLTKHYNDFGITLAQYGITTSPYLVLPVIGPSSIRDALALWPNYRYLSLWGYMDREPRIRNAMIILDIINLRASLLSSEDIARQASLDQYVFIRDAYLQKRASLIKRYTGRNVGYGNKANANDDPLSDDYIDDAVVDRDVAADLSNNNAPTSNADTQTKTNGDTNNSTPNEVSTKDNAANTVIAPPPVSFRQPTQDPVKQSLAQNELDTLTEMDG
ncbi:MAG: VacJ family lipoprotein [Gammaproteobacteria bacterium]|nr:VacJ family lipoprotein [Gammaproteobacteria bacterium]